MEPQIQAQTMKVTNGFEPLTNNNIETTQSGDAQYMKRVCKRVLLINLRDEDNYLECEGNQQALQIEGAQVVCKRE